jgi:hypothetical protein
VYWYASQTLWANKKADLVTVLQAEPFATMPPAQRVVGVLGKISNRRYTGPNTPKLNFFQKFLQTINWKA